MPVIKRHHLTALSSYTFTEASVLTAVQMATLDKAEALLEDLRSASWDAAVKDLDEVKAFAAKQVCVFTQALAGSLPMLDNCLRLVPSVLTADVLVAAVLVTCHVKSLISLQSELMSIVLN